LTIVHVDLPGRAYDIHIGADLLAAAAALLAPHLHRPRLAVVTEERVAAAHGRSLHDTLSRAGIESEALVLPPGEGSKDWATLGRTVEWLLERKVERNDLVLAFGGGVIGDLAGFAAAILRRGVRFAQMPTTLLAQVDSSVGGKTGINTAQGKNLVGAFHQPVLVIADTALLSTLPRRDLLSGYGEVVKYGLLGDAAFFGWLEAQGPDVLSDPDALERAVVRSCEMKARIVERDETETGERALLNLGHTFAHALEAATGYSDRLLHGEAVAVGLGLAFDLSARLGLCPQEEPSRVRAHLRAMGMKARLADIPGPLPGPEALLALMAQDKKAVAGRLRFILARGIGKAFVADGVPQEAVIATLRDG
jgi:3-dehydroquinate synthase